MTCRATHIRSVEASPRPCASTPSNAARRPAPETESALATEHAAQRRASVADNHLNTGPCGDGYLPCPGESVTSVVGSIRRQSSSGASLLSYLRAWQRARRGARSWGASVIARLARVNTLSRVRVVMPSLHEVDLPSTRVFSRLGDLLRIPIEFELVEVPPRHAMSWRKP